MSASAAWLCILDFPSAWAAEQGANQACSQRQEALITPFQQGHQVQVLRQTGCPVQGGDTGPEFNERAGAAQRLAIRPVHMKSGECRRAGKVGRQSAIMLADVQPVDRLRLLSPLIPGDLPAAQRAAAVVKHGQCWLGRRGRRVAQFRSSASGFRHGWGLSMLVGKVKGSGCMFQECSPSTRSRWQAAMGLEPGAVASSAMTAVRFRQRSGGRMQAMGHAERQGRRPGDCGYVRIVELVPGQRTCACMVSPCWMYSCNCPGHIQIRPVPEKPQSANIVAIEWHYSQNNS